MMSYISWVKKNVSLSIVDPLNYVKSSTHFLRFSQSCRLVRDFFASILQKYIVETTSLISFIHLARLTMGVT